jgi:hypothetical protein
MQQYGATSSDALNSQQNQLATLNQHNIAPPPFPTHTRVTLGYARMDAGCIERRRDLNGCRIVPD